MHFSKISDCNTLIHAKKMAVVRTHFENNNDIGVFAKNTNS